MPMVYFAGPAGLEVTTNAATNTANDFYFLTPGATRTVWLTAAQAVGKAGGATSLSSIAIRGEKWTSTASSGGTGITPRPEDPGYQASKCSAGSSATTVTSGTGGPVFLFGFGFGLSGPGGWNYLGDLSAAPALEGAATQSVDMFNISNTASLKFELLDVRVQE